MFLGAREQQPGCSKCYLLSSFFLINNNATCIGFLLNVHGLVACQA
jgi:hypothetical protein